MAQHPFMAEIQYPKNCILVGPNSHQDLCNLWAKVHQTFFAERRKNGSGNIGFPILDILSRSGDIRDRSRMWYKIDQNLHVFGPQIF